MRIFVASDTGVVKAISPERNISSTVSTAAPSRELESDAMCWSSDRFGLFVAHKSGVVKSYLSVDHTGASLPTLAAERLAGLHCPKKSNIAADFIGCSVTGNIKALSAPDTVVFNFTTGGKMSCMRVDAADKWLACGDLHKNGAQKWLAKNVADDEYSLRRPVWVKDMRFFHGSAEKLAISTAHGQIRIYDQKAQRRPVLDVKVGKYPLNCIDLTSDDMVIYTGDTFGNVMHYDIRLTGKLLGGFKGTGGSVRALQLHASEPYVASTGLDRFIRVHNIKTRKLAFKIYAKQAQNCLLFDATVPFEEVKKEEEEELEGEADTDAPKAVSKKQRVAEQPKSKKKPKAEEEGDEDEGEDSEEGGDSNDDGEDDDSGNSESEGGDDDSGDSDGDDDDDDGSSDVDEMLDSLPDAETSKRKRPAAVRVLRGGTQQQGGRRGRGRGRGRR